MRNTLTVLVADDELLVAQALSRLVTQWYVALEPVTRFSELSATLIEQQPRVLLLDLIWRADQVNALSYLPELRAAAPETATIIVTGHDNHSYLETALSEGVRGYLLKECAPSELWVAIEEVPAGRAYLTPALAGPGGLDLREPVEPIRGLQWEVLRRKQAGWTNQQVALDLERDTSVIGYHLRELRRKLGIPPRITVDWRSILVSRVTDSRARSRVRKGSHPRPGVPSGMDSASRPQFGRVHKVV